MVRRKKKMRKKKMRNIETFRTVLKSLPWLVVLAPTSISSPTKPHKHLGVDWLTMSDGRLGLNVDHRVKHYVNSQNGGSWVFTWESPTWLGPQCGPEGSTLVHGEEEEKKSVGTFLTLEKSLS